MDFSRISTLKPFWLRHRSLSCIGHLVLCGTLCGMFDRSLGIRWQFRRLRRKLWLGAQSIRGRLPILKRRRPVRSRLMTHRSIGVEDWCQREMRDGMRRATMRDKLSTMKQLRVASPGDRQWLHNTVLELLRELDDMQAEELNFARRASLCLLW